MVEVKRNPTRIVLLIITPILFLSYYFYKPVLALIAGEVDWLAFLLLKLANLVATIDFSLPFILLNLTITLASLGAEAIIIGWENSSIRRLILEPSGSTRIDLYCWLLSLLGLFKFISILASLGITYFLFGLLSKGNQLDLLAHISNPVLQYVALFVFSDFIFYWKHRLSHKLTWWWELHKYHHAAKELNMITTHRQHFLEQALTMLFDVVPFMLLGVPLQEFLFLHFVKQVVLLFVHSSIRWSAPGILKYIFISPSAHRIHHSTDKAHFNKNFGTFFSSWDHLFGTWYEPEAVCNVGVEGDTTSEMNFLQGMLVGYKRMLAQLVWRTEP